jgi:hypothetical protein
LRQPPSLHAAKQEREVGSQTPPSGQSALTPHATHVFCATSQRGSPGVVHCWSFTQGTQVPEGTSQWSDASGQS